MTAGRLPEASQRLTSVAETLDPQTAPATWGEYLRLRGALEAQNGAPTDAYHDFAQSATLLDPRRNSKLAWTWSHLPLSVANRIGPHVRRRLSN